MNADALDRKLDAFIAETAANQAATLRDQALAAFAKGDNAAAEKLAGNAANQIGHGPGTEDFKRPLIRDMYKLAGEAAVNQKEWGKAENWYRQSLAVTSAETEPRLLADIGLALGRVFEEQERINEAAAAVIQVKTTLGQKLDELGDQGVAFLNGLARFQFLGAKYAESALTLKDAIGLSEKVSSGIPTGNTVYAWKLLAGAYLGMGRKDEAKAANAKTDAILSAAMKTPSASLVNSLDSLRLSEESAVVDIVRERQLRNGERIKVIEANVKAWASRVETMDQLEHAWDGALDTENRVLTVMNWRGYAAMAVFLLFGFPCLILFVRHQRRKPLEPKLLDHPLPESSDALTGTPEDLLRAWALV